MVDLEWVPGNVTDFSKYELCRDGSPIATITDRSTTFYRDTGLTNGIKYHYELRYYNATGELVGTTGTRATTGEVHGTITQDTTWTAASSPYILHAGAPSLVQVFNGATLTIESGVKVINYEIYVGGTEGQKGVLYADGSSFYDCGIIVWYEAHAEIKNCSFEDKGISLCSSYNTLTGNTVYNSGIGLSSSSNNVIADNNVSNGGGIGLYNSSHNTLTGNTADFNSGVGIDLGYSSDYNTLTGNTCNWNLDGICLYSSSNNILTDNTAYSNDQSGIFLWKSSSNTLTDNTAYDNLHNGISLCSSSNNMLTGNTAYDNSLNGIDLYSSDYNTLTSNTANSNSNYGIYLTSSSSDNDYRQLRIEPQVQRNLPEFFKR
jgi:parallel beta-helix repeat protein